MKLDKRRGRLLLTRICALSVATLAFSSLAPGAAMAQEFTGRTRVVPIGASAGLADVLNDNRVAVMGFIFEDVQPDNDPDFILTNYWEDFFFCCEWWVGVVIGNASDDIVEGDLKVTIKGPATPRTYEQPIVIAPEQAVVVAFEVELDDMAAMYLVKAKLSNSGKKGPKVIKGAFTIADERISREQRHP